MLTHIHPSRAWFACENRSYIKGNGYPSTMSEASPEPPSAQSPFARLGRYPWQRDVQHLVRGRYPSFIAHTDSCVRPNPSRCLGMSSYTRSLQVVTSPCWEMVLPDIISAILA